MGTNNSQETKTTLVLGGTGKTGRRIVERLAARGLPVRVGSRSGEPPFDWEDEATWVPALRDVESVYVSYYPDLAVPGAVAVVRSFATQASQNRTLLQRGAREPGGARRHLGSGTLVRQRQESPALEVPGGARSWNAGEARCVGRLRPAFGRRRGGDRAGDGREPRQV